MTSAEGAAAVSGFRLMLPDDWVILDLNPETAAESIRQVIDSMVEIDSRCAERRADVEELLSVMAEEAIAEEKLLCGLRFGVDDQGSPLQAVVSVFLQAVDGPADPDTLYEQLDDESAEARIAMLCSGPALRVRRVTGEGFMSWAAFLPVPDVDGAVTVISLRSPNRQHSDRLDAFFDGLIESFQFTINEEAEVDE